MVKVLIEENRIEILKIVFNEIIGNNSQAVISYIITSNTIETIEALKKEQIDIIMLDYNILKQNENNILNYIKNKKYIKSIITMSECKENKRLCNNMYIYTDINIGRINHDDIEKVKGLIKRKQNNSINFRIHKEMEKLNFNFSYSGTNYLEEAIKLLYYYQNIEDVRIEQTIYKKISIKHNKSVNTIKTNIINATNNICYDCKLETLNEYFYGNIKPTPKTVMITIIKNIKEET